jgi:hypothetical protein
MGGHARLTSPMYLPHDQIEMETANPQSLSGVVKMPLSPGAVDLGAIDSLPINIPAVVECAPGLFEQDPPGMLGTPVHLTGRLLGTTRQQPRLLWLEGPRYSESWPLVGALPDPVPISMAGTYTFDGLPGAWIRPAPQVVDISAGLLPSRTAIEDSRPAVASPEALTWSARSPIAPSARLLDLDAQARWQQGLVVASLLFGVAASLLATLVLQFMGRPQPQTPVAAPPGNPGVKHQRGPDQHPPRWAIALLVALLAGRWIRARGRRHRGR